MSKRMELEGQQFGLWTVGAYAGMGKNGGRWHCRCECGTERIVSSQMLREGRSRSCGCDIPRAIRTLKQVHGHSPRAGKSRTYRIWRHMIRRCHSPTEHNYQWYGALGIKVCARWRASFVAFLQDMGEAPPDKELDREDPLGNYTPENCRWVTHAENMRNNWAFRRRFTS
jgi:hypothetical protein